MNRTDRILDCIDAGLQTADEWAMDIGDQTDCWRCGDNATTDSPSGVCEPCRTALLDETTGPLATAETSHGWEIPLDTLVIAPTTDGPYLRLAKWAEHATHAHILIVGLHTVWAWRPGRASSLLVLADDQLTVRGHPGPSLTADTVQHSIERWFVDYAIGNIKEQYCVAASVSYVGQDDPDRIMCWLGWAGLTGPMPEAVAI